MSVQDVLNHHLESFSAGDVEETLRDYTEDSVLITPDGVLRGIDAVRGVLTELYTGLFKPGTYSFEMDRVEVVGDVAFIAWHSSNAGAKVTLGTDTFIIRDGKIVLQTFAARVEPA